MSWKLTDEIPVLTNLPLPSTFHLEPGEGESQV